MIIAGDKYKIWKNNDILFSQGRRDWKVLDSCLENELALGKSEGRFEVFISWKKKEVF